MRGSRAGEATNTGRSRLPAAATTPHIYRTLRESTRLATSFPRTSSPALRENRESVVSRHVGVLLRVVRGAEHDGRSAAAL